jgi:glycosyltransferase involved in cell wall biosynthesis
MKTTIAADKVRVIYHGIDLDNFDGRISSGPYPGFTNPSGVILGNAGRLTSQKGQQYLIEIASRLKQKNIRFTLYIAGTGEMQSELETLIEKNNLHNEVVLLGFVEDVENFMQAIDIFVLSSVWEGFGYVIVEAMAACKPVVAFDISSNPEIIIRDQTGFLIEYPDLEMFCSKIELLINDEILRRQFGKKGRETVETFFQLDDRIKEFENYLLLVS